MCTLQLSKTVLHTNFVRKKYIVANQNSHLTTTGVAIIILKCVEYHPCCNSLFYNLILSVKIVKLRILSSIGCIICC